MRIFVNYNSYFFAKMSFGRVSTSVLKIDVIYLNEHTETTHCHIHFLKAKILLLEALSTIKYVHVPGILLAHTHTHESIKNEILKR